MNNLLNEIAAFLTPEGKINKNRLTKSTLGKDLSRRLKELNPDQTVPQTIWDLRYGRPVCAGCKKITPQFRDGKYLTYCGAKCSSTHNGAGKKLGEYVKTEKFKRQRSRSLKLKFGTDSMATLNLARKISEGHPHPLSLPENQLLGLLKRKENFKALRLPRILDDLKKKDIVPINNGLPEYETFYDKYKWKHLTCEMEFEGSIGSSCLKCASKVTAPHQRIVDLIYGLCPTLICEINDRSVIAPQEIDIYLSELKLGIEVNGIYWHSERAGRGSEYHLKKTERAEAVGIKLIQITEDEIYDQWEIVESRIKSALGKTERIYARKCKIIEVDSSISHDFIARTHIQGPVGAKVKLGLMYEDKLVAMMTFGHPRFNKKYEWELLRYCTELGMTVVGGASKLLREFRRTEAGSIISYADRRWSNGSLYRKLGFTELNPSSPSYVYTNKFTSHRVNRFAAQKHKLKDLLGDEFDPNLSEPENMLAAGYDRTFDCGNRVFEL